MLEDKELHVYTDGACSGNPGPGGWGFVVARKVDFISKCGAEKLTTNNRMELTSAIEAIVFVMTYYKKLKGLKLVIHSDSAYVVNAVNRKWMLSWSMNNWKTAKGEDVKNRDLWEALYKLLYKDAYKYGMQISFDKVKGHSGVAMNELADKLARNAANKVK